MISFKKILNNFDEFEKELDGEYSEKNDKDGLYLYLSIQIINYLLLLFNIIINIDTYQTNFFIYFIF